MPGDTPVPPSRKSWRSPSPPRGAPPPNPSGRVEANDADFGDPSSTSPFSTAAMRQALDVEAAKAAPKPTATAQTQEDPRELARRLGQEAKARMAAAQPKATGGLAGSAPPPRPAAPPPRPVAPPPPQAGPKAQAAYQPSLDDPLDDDSFPEPEPAQEYLPLGDDEPLPPVRALKPLSTRPLPPPPKPAARNMSAADALKAAMEAERAPTAPKPVARAAARAPEPEPEPTLPRKLKKGPAPTLVPVPPRAKEPATGIHAVIPNGTFGTALPVSRPEVFRALWRAHRARAQHDRDLALLATAMVLLDAVDRIPSPGLVAYRVEVGDEAWAAWFDVNSGLLLGAAQPADVYLAGL